MIPLLLFLAGAFTFVATGLAGLSVIVRYLLVPVGDAEPVRGVRARRLHDAAARLARRGASGRSALARSRSRSGSSTRRSTRRASCASTTSCRSAASQGRSLHALLGHAAVVSDGLRCGAVSVPTHKLIPDTRWVLDLPRAGSSRARTRPPRPSARRATAWRSSRPAARTSCAPASPSTPTRSRRCRRPGFHRIATDRYFAAYLRCPPGRA